MKQSKKILTLFIVIVFAWVFITNIVQAFTNPNMTQTELFIAIPKSFALDFSPKNN